MQVDCDPLVNIAMVEIELGKERKAIKRGIRNGVVPAPEVVEYDRHGNPAYYLWRLSTLRRWKEEKRVAAELFIKYPPDLSSSKAREAKRATAAASTAAAERRQAKKAASAA